MKTLALATLLACSHLQAANIHKGAVLSLEDTHSIEDPVFRFAPDWRVWYLTQIESGWAVFAWDWDGDLSQVRIEIKASSLKLRGKWQHLIYTQLANGARVSSLKFIEKVDGATDDGFPVVVYRFEAL